MPTFPPKTVDEPVTPLDNRPAPFWRIVMFLPLLLFLVSFAVLLGVFLGMHLRNHRAENCAVGYALGYLGHWSRYMFRILVYGPL